MVYFAQLVYTQTARPTTTLITLNHLWPFLPTLAPQFLLAPASLWFYVGIHSPPCCSIQLTNPQYNATQPLGGIQTRAASLWRPSPSGDRPALRKHFGLLQYCLSRLFLFVGRVAVPTENAAHQDSKVSADVFTERPVDGNVVADGVDKLAGDVPQRLVAQDLHGAVVGLQSVVEGKLVFR